MIDIEEQKIFERADKITERLFKALYSEEEGETIDYPTLMCALGKFTASVLLAVQEQGKILDVEDDFIKAVKDVKASMGKDMKMQKIKEERDQIKLKIKENEEKIKELEREQEETLKRFSLSNHDVLN
jgi:TusA-related sulfurtransferase